jgi:hypothetical protein
MARAAFLSHSSADAHVARDLCAALEARGVACWIAPRDIAEGRPYALGCLEGVAESESFVLVGTEHALASMQVLSEVEQAHKRAKPIYTILIPPAKVRGEMDFYISRLHWMQAGGKSTDDIAAKLASVLGRSRDWDEVASPPTLRRTMQYRPIAFLKLVAAIGLVLALMLGGTVFALNRSLNLDFRRWGYVELSAESTGNGVDIGHAQVWLLAPGVRFADVHLKATVETASQTFSQQEISKWPIPLQMGSMEQVELPFNADARRITSCLVIPKSGAGIFYRVTQQFAVTSLGKQISVVETAEARVSKEDGTACTVRP